MTTPPSNAMPRLLVGAKEASRLLSISTRTLWTHTKSNAIPSKRLGNRVLYSPEELHAWQEINCPTDPGAADGVRRHLRKRGAK